LRQQASGILKEGLVMKTYRLALLALVVLPLIAGCVIKVYDDDDHPDHTPPDAPHNVRTVTGDRQVTIYWDPVYAPDLDRYGVYYSYTAYGQYTRIADTRETFFVDTGIQNGTTIYYAVDAVDHHGNESPLSYEIVSDTPRPAGYNARLWDRFEYPDEAGFDFSRYEGGNAAMVVAFDDESVDFWVEEEDGEIYLVVLNDTKIMDYGYTEHMDDVDEAPSSGWAQDGWVVAQRYHAYVIRTWEENYAKIRITNMYDDGIKFDWAYQTDPGNPELVPGPPPHAGGNVNTRPLPPLTSRSGSQGSD
jgi:hypothetical protein